MYRPRPEAKMGISRRLAGVALGATAVLAAPAAADSGGAPGPGQGSSSGPVQVVGADGNVFTGGLKFDPADITVAVGQVVRWKNNDSIVPHTATEVHGLWDLTGDYGATPANPSGFGPGETRERAFEAGTQHYYCKVHPQQMKGTISVPVQLALKRAPASGASPRGAAKPRKRLIVVTWASAPPAQGQAFDAQRRRGNGDWVTFAQGSTAASGTFSAGKRRKRKTVWQVRARLHVAGSDSLATDWSPVVSISS